MISSAALMALLLITQSPRAAVDGQRIELRDAVLFIPRDYRTRDDLVNVVLHLHGAASVIEPALREANWNAVLIQFNRRGLSRVYAEPFSDKALFPRLLDDALEQIKQKALSKNPRVGKVIVSSFSAGFGGVRELLKVPEHFARIDALVMADSLYCGYAGDPGKKQVDPKLMEGFERFARESAVGHKRFLLTHSAQVPAGYASTTETADFLIARLAGAPRATRVVWDPEWVQTREFSAGGFVVFGFEGVDADAHMKHLRNIGRLWKRQPVDDRKER
jgi:hypothetical protein